MDPIAPYRWSRPGLRRLGYLSMVALVALAAVFFRERAWFLDVAFQTFLLINEGSVQVMVNRFGAALVQLLPLIGIKAGAPLPVISLLYSISFPLLYLAFYTLIVRLLRNDLLGWALVFLYTLIVYDAFYWAISEQQQGLGALLVFYAYWLRFPRQEKPWMWAVSTMGVVALAYYHPLVFIPFYFLWAFFGLHLRKKITGRPYWLLAGIMAVVLALKSRFSGNWYDDGKYDTFFNNLEAYFPNYFSLPAHAKFLDNTLSTWYFFPVFLLIVTLFYFFHRYWLKLALVLAACFGYLMLLHIGSPESTYRFYAEVNYMALTIFVMVPFLFDIAPRLKGQWTVALFSVIVAIRLFSIALHHQPYEARWRWIARTLAQQPAGYNRFYLSEQEAPMDTLIMTWGVPYESLVISGSESPKTLLIHPDLSLFSEALKSDTVFITPFKTYSIDQLNSTFFPLGKGEYRPIQLPSRQ
ncbi:MAG: hypothetical protein KDD06_03455 [Phaeodactylibacter sp.]|nr:hypothetical protein [Phaeodactylibacter sp.]MCB9266538.1 hypothetical protein [Lewinellaceae bacterium]MCB9288020.1 hypothetical protein [Lewinellaceae bacterium]